MWPNVCYPPCFLLSERSNGHEAITTTNMTNGIEKMVNDIEWVEYEWYPSLDGLQATHEGILKIGDHQFTCYKLNDEEGSVVLKAEDVEAFFGILHGG